MHLGARRGLLGDRDVHGGLRREALGPKSAFCRASSASALTQLRLRVGELGVQVRVVEPGDDVPFLTRVPSVTFNCVMRDVIFGERSALRSASM